MKLLLFFFSAGAVGSRQKAKVAPQTFRIVLRTHGLGPRCIGFPTAWYRGYRSIAKLSQFLPPEIMKDDVLFTKRIEEQSTKVSRVTSRHA